MASPQLKNHLRSQRKRSALSQDELAFLLGAQSGAKVCRYERFSRAPTLETVLAYEMIFQKPARDLFPGLYREVERKVTGRATALSYRMGRRKPARQTARKLEVLGAIIKQMNLN